VVNADDYESGKDARPLLEERGPYYYKEPRLKDNILWTGNDHVRFRQRKTYFFDKELSCADCYDTDTPVVFNLALNGIVYIIDTLPLPRFVIDPVLSLFNQIIKVKRILSVKSMTFVLGRID